MYTDDTKRRLAALIGLGCGTTCGCKIGFADSLDDSQTMMFAAAIAGKSPELDRQVHEILANNVHDESPVHGPFDDSVAFPGLKATLSGLLALLMGRPAHRPVVEGILIIEIEDGPVGWHRPGQDPHRGGYDEHDHQHGRHRQHADVRA